jgi:hypothetical protein
MLRRTFRRWGLPDRVRVDNGHPWGSRNDLPRELALWLIGLGVVVIWNRPRCPRMNGVVERSQGVTQQWVEPTTQSDPAVLQARLDWAIRIQREVYPAVRGHSRLEAFPGLKTPRRAYHIDQEEQMWKLVHVDAYLQQAVWRRTVNQSGQISLYHWNYTVGRQWRGQEVNVRLDPSRRAWVVMDDQGRELRSHPAEQLTAERIRGLEVSHRRPQ